MSNLEQARVALGKHFGFAEFLPGQAEAIEAVLAGHDTLIVMPTGGGKSLCYQLPALVLEGVTLVVSPLIALMKDQVDALASRGIAATAINSTLGEEEMARRLSALAQGQFRLVYVAPERFRSDRFLRNLEHVEIALFAVDEAHCVSQWGHDFRPDYLRIREVLREVGQPPVAALTATATPDVRDDIATQLSLGQCGRNPPRVFVSGFARPNLTLRVARVSGNRDKLTRILRTIRERGSGIIYCATRKNVERLASELSKERVRALTYHGGLPDAQRRTAQESFMAERKPVIVATNAFGMGIDRPDLRFVLHHDIPGSLESYYQEAGRAGRDGEVSECTLLFNFADVRTQEFFLEGANPSPTVIRGVYSLLCLHAKDGVCTLTTDTIASRLPQRVNGMAVETALLLLDRAGMIAYESASDLSGSEHRILKLDLKASELPIDFSALEEKRQRDRRRLARMIQYADARGCRHRFILDYFGDVSANAPCSACDNCRIQDRPATRPPDAEETILIQKALSGVARMNGRFGRGRIAQVLTGSVAKEIRGAGLDQLSTHGILKAEGTDYILALLDALVMGGCLDVLPGDFPLLALTDMGNRVMRRQEVVALALPPRRAAKPARTALPALGVSEEEPPYDQRLFDQLRGWRREKAAESGSPAYLIFSDRTLRELCRRKPSDEVSLLGIRGIGPARAARFGPEVLQLLRVHH
jgi:ATP-dependent DNA helicase RecQ